MKQWSEDEVIEMEKYALKLQAKGYDFFCIDDVVEDISMAKSYREQLIVSEEEVGDVLKGIDDYIRVANNYQENLSLNPSLMRRRRKYMRPRFRTK